MNRSFVPLAACLLLHLALVAAYAAAFRGDLSALVCVSDTAIGQPPFEHIHIGFPKNGFDGQYYYALAQNPWQTHSPNVIAEPAYRHVRILFPAIAWLLSGGDPVRLFWVLPGLNLAAIVGIAWLGMLIAKAWGRGPWWGFLLPVVLNLGMSSLRDLTDPVATFALMGVLAAWYRRWPAWSLFLWALATALGREQNCLIVLFVAVAAYRKQDNSRAVAAVASFIPMMAWVLILRGMYGDWPTAPGNLGWPFEGMLHRWTHLEGLAGRVSIVIHIAGMLILTAQVVLSLVMPAYRPSALPLGIALAGAALAILGGTGIFLNGWSYSRVFFWMPLGLWLWSTETGRRWPLAILSATVLWPVAAVLQVWSR